MPDNMFFLVLLSGEGYILNIFIFNIVYTVYASFHQVCMACLKTI